MAVWICVTLQADAGETAVVVTQGESTAWRVVDEERVTAVMNSSRGVANQCSFAWLVDVRGRKRLRLSCGVVLPAMPGVP